jgi:hypothetical protein
MAEIYTTIVNYIETTLSASPFDLDQVAKGASLDDALNSDTKGVVVVTEPEDYREVESSYTGGDYTLYHVDLNYVVAGDEAATASKAREFGDDIRTAFLHDKNKISGGVHSDTRIDWGEAKVNEWNQSTSQRVLRHRLTYFMSEDYS